ncbi:hypothetical protein ACFLRN_09380 [Thermoproteota archaeon]
MADHGVIDLSKKKIEEYVFLESQANWKRFYDFVVELNLKPYCFQHKENRYTCWYVGFVDVQKSYILHFKINKTSLALWFRRPQFLSKLGQEKTKSDNNYRYVAILSVDNTIKQILSDYVKAIEKPFYQGKIKPDQIDQHKNC